MFMPRIEPHFPWLFNEHHEAGVMDDPMILWFSWSVPTIDSILTRLRDPVRRGPAVGRRRLRLFLVYSALLVPCPA